MIKRKILPSICYEFLCEDGLLKQTIEQVQKLEWEYNRTNCKSIQNINCIDEFQPLMSWFQTCVDKVKNDLNLPFDELVITQAWANRSFYNEWHQPHTHANSFLSAVFYLTTSSSGLTWFSRQNEWLDFFLLKPKENEKPVNRNIVHKELPISGKLFLFPSNLVHSVEEHFGSSARYTISFNTFPGGEIEKDGFLRYLNIKVIPAKN